MHKLLTNIRKPCSKKYVACVFGVDHCLLTTAQSCEEVPRAEVLHGEMVRLA